MSIVTYDLFELSCKRPEIRQTAIKSKDGMWYIVSSNKDLDTQIIDAFLYGKTFESETMIFHGNKEGITSYNDLWLIRPMNHDKGIERAIEGDFK